METVQLTVTLTKSPEFGLGIEFSGGTDCGSKDVGIYVNAVIPGGPAEGNLKPGDLLLGCNGSSLRRVTHDAAIAQLQRNSVVSLLVERKLEKKAALAMSEPFEIGIQQAQETDDHTGFLVEVTFSVRSFETQKSHLVMCKTLDSINGVSVQQLTSPAHFARLVDSAQSTTLRYKPTATPSQSSSGKSDTTTNAGRSGSNVSIDVQIQQQQSLPPYQISRQKSELERLAIATSAQMSPQLPLKLRPYGQSGDLTTSVDYQDSSHQFTKDLGRSPSENSSGTGQPARKVNDRKVISTAGSTVNDAIKNGGVPPTLLSGQYGVNIGSQIVNGREALSDRRGSDNPFHAGLRAGVAGIREVRQQSLVLPNSADDDMLSQQIEQTRTRRVGHIYNPIEAQPVGSTATKKETSDKGFAIGEMADSPIIRRNDYSFIHRIVDKPADSRTPSAQQVAQRPQENPNNNGRVRQSSSLSKEVEPGQQRNENRPPALEQEATSSSPKSQQRPEQQAAAGKREDIPLNSESRSQSPVVIRQRKLDQRPTSYLEGSRDSALNQQRQLEHVGKPELFEERSKDHAHSQPSHHRTADHRPVSYIEDRVRDRTHSTSLSQSRKLAHQPISYVEDNSKERRDGVLNQGKPIQSAASGGKYLERRMSEKPESQQDSQESIPKKRAEEQTLPTGQRERIRSQKDEPLQTGFTVGGYKFEQPVNVSRYKFEEPVKASPKALEQTRLVLPDPSRSIGVTLDGGNAVGIFVQKVTPGAAADRAGIQPGDRLLAVDDSSLVNATKEEALLTLLRAKDRALQVTLVPDSIGHRNFRASQKPGDRFFVRAHFSHSTPAPGESAFKRNDVFLVRDTMAGGVIGNWEAVRVHPPPVETQSRVIPCANRADQIVMATAGSELPTAFPPYERVAQRRATFCRPVVILGPFADLVRDYLTKTLPDRFEQPKQAGQIVKLSVIRALVARGKHCVLDLNPVALDRLCFAQLAPIVLFVRAANRMVVKKVRKERGSKKVYQESQRIERWCSHLFTGVFTVDQPDLNALLAGLDGLIHLQQGQLLWLAEKDERPVRVLSEPNLCCSKNSHDGEKQPNFSGLDTLATDASDEREDDWRQEWHRFTEGHLSGSRNSIASGHAEDAGNPFDTLQPSQQQRPTQLVQPVSQCSGIFDFSGGSLRCSRTGAELEIPAGALAVGRLLKVQLAVLGGRTLLLGPPGVRFLRPVIVWLPPNWREATLVTANLSESGQATDWEELNWPDVSASRRGDDETVVCITGDRFEPVMNN